MDAYQEVKHTPGPWSLVYKDDGTLELGGGPNHSTGVHSDAGFGCIANVLYKKTNFLGDSKVLQYQTFEANAKLIADSPLMFDYIKKRAEAGDPEAQAILNRHA